MADLMKTLGGNVTRLRNEKGMSRKNFSTLVGLSEMELKGIEEGTADIDTGLACRIAMSLGVGIEDIICSEQTRKQLLEQVKNKLSLCSEKDLALIFEYMTRVLKK